MINSIRCFFLKLYREYTSLIIIGIYMIVYMVAFNYLENRVGYCHIINFSLDRYIPFCEYFIVPYLLWFPYVALIVLWLCIKDKEESLSLVMFLISGMSIFVFICALFPNGHHLRPTSFERSNVFISIIQRLYKIDTSTNVVPSIHVYNSVAIMISIWRTQLLKHHEIIKWVLLILGCSIICSTVLIKQHSLFDVLVALFLSGIMYPICYNKNKQVLGHLSLFHN